MKNLLIILTASSVAMSACTSTTTYTVELLKSPPKGMEKLKKVTQKKKSFIWNGPERSEAVVQVIDIGPTVDDTGSLRAPHKYYRLIKTETWLPGMPGKGMPKTVPTFVKEGSPTDKLNKAVERAEAAAKRVEDAFDKGTAQTNVSPPVPADPPPDPTNIDTYMHPQIPSDDQALRDAANSNPTPAP